MENLKNNLREHFDDCEIIVRANAAGFRGVTLFRPKTQVKTEKKVFAVKLLGFRGKWGWRPKKWKNKVFATNQRSYGFTSYYGVTRCGPFPPLATPLLEGVENDVNGKLLSQSTFVCWRWAFTQAKSSRQCTLQPSASYHRENVNIVNFKLSKKKEDYK